jgi:hypothetical protein
MKRYTTRIDRLKARLTSSRAETQTDASYLPLFAGEVQELRRRYFKQRLGDMIMVLVVVCMVGAATVFLVNRQTPTGPPVSHTEQTSPPMVGEHEGLQDHDVPIRTASEKLTVGPLIAVSPPEERVTWTPPTHVGKERPHARSRPTRSSISTDQRHQQGQVSTDVEPRVEEFYKYEITPGRSYRYGRIPPVGNDYIDGKVPPGGFLISHPQ